MRRRLQRRHGRSRSVFVKHARRIARDTARMPEAMIGVMGDYRGVCPVSGGAHHLVRPTTNRCECGALHGPRGWSAPGKGMTGP